jgi:hypothetical protein
MTADSAMTMFRVRELMPVPFPAPERLAPPADDEKPL